MGIIGRKRVFSTWSLSSSPLIFSFVLGLIVFLSQGFTLVFALNYATEYRQVSSLRLARIQRHLDKINKPPVFTILSPDGDTIDCVPKRKQPAFDHPLLKNHKIQREPPDRPKIKASLKVEEEKQLGDMTYNTVGQMWHQNGTRCPRGSVPIRRSTVHDVLRAKSVYNFGRKQPRFHLDRRRDAPDVISGNGHEHAIAYYTSGLREGREIYGAKATMNVWDPSIEEGNEFSLSQIWILSGSFDSDLNSIEAGWQVSPELYGDNRPRLFTYWTSDAYQATGCYNLLCSGFILTNSRMAIGAAISPVSSFNGNQYDITVLIWKDPKLGNWWMGLGDGILVGYWPAELFSHLGDHATMVEWGGEVVNTRANEEHTATQMGSGQFSGGGFGKASYFRNLEIVDSDNSLSSAGDVQTLAERTDCYDIERSYNADWGTYFYYGGPGRNPGCP